jgi:hypothetical protein
MTLAGNTQSTWSKTSHFAELCKTNFSQIYLDLNPRLRGAKTFNFSLSDVSFLSGGGSNVVNLKYCKFTRYFYQYELQRSSSIKAWFVCDS